MFQFLGWGAESLRAESHVRSPGFSRYPSWLAAGSCDGVVRHNFYVPVLGAPPAALRGRSGSLVGGADLRRGAEHECSEGRWRSRLALPMLHGAG